MPKKANESVEDYCKRVGTEPNFSTKKKKRIVKKTPKEPGSVASGDPTLREPEVAEPVPEE